MKDYNELMEYWKPILQFKSEKVGELPESEWKKYIKLFTEAEEKHKDNMFLLRYLIPHLRRTGQYPETKFNDYGFYYEIKLISDISGKDIIVGVPHDSEIAKSLPWYRIMLLGYIIPKYTFLISPNMEELYPKELSSLKSTHEFGVDV